MPADISSVAGDAGLQTAIRGLYATPTAPLPFLSGVVVRAFVLERPQGNLIIYNAPGLTAAAPEIAALGPPQRLLVNHWHEAMYGAPQLDVPIFVHDADRRQTRLPIAGTFSTRHHLADDLEVIPTPGHTPGTTAFLWDNGEHRLLFPGDSLWVQGGEWKAVLLGESDRAAYLASLALLMDVEFDFLVPWGSEDGQPYAYGVSRAQARRNLGGIVSRLAAGESA
jgi:glyoxylase-like metal-dependent hydrolase (beta-lactamase superfamily II)